MNAPLSMTTLPPIEEVLSGPPTEREVEKLALLFADVPCPYVPTGEWVCLQEPVLPEKSSGGIVLPYESQEGDRIRNTIGRVHLIGPLCGLSKVTDRPLPNWPEYGIGDFVRVSPHSHTRMEADAPGAPREIAYFRLIFWKDVMARVILAGEILRTLRQK